MIPSQLQNPSFNFVLLGMKEKKPYEKNWQNLVRPYTCKEVQDNIAAGKNIGVIGGYGNLRIIDADEHSLAEELSKKVDTFTIKTGSGGRHFYFISEYDTNHVFAGERGEVRAKNYQVVIPGCIHPNGNKYEIIEDKPIKEISKEEFYSIIKPYLRTEKENIESTKNTKDESRSGEEMRKVIQFIKEGLSREAIFEAMKDSDKWKSSPKGYKELTYHKAKKWIEENQNQDIKTKKKLKIKENIKFVSFLCYEKEGIKYLAEQVYSNDKVQFAIYNTSNDSIEYAPEIDLDVKHKPINDEEVMKKAVLLPSEITKYSSEQEIDNKIKNFINRWLDIPDSYIKFAIWNIKKSYVYDKYHTLNYLRALGDLGQGKSRFLDTLGSLHYKPIFASGATTAAPLFRIITKWKGTIVLDEADLPKTDEAELIIKIINLGYEKGKQIMRCDSNDITKINFYDPYCPKIIASRKEFEDKAVESRCITNVMKGTTRKDIPLNINDSFEREACEIRNMLTYWRFKKYYQINPEQEITFDFGDLEPRLKQIVYGYANLYSDDIDGLTKLKEFMAEQQIQIRQDRQSSFAGSIVGGIYSLLLDKITEFDSSDIIEKAKICNKDGSLINARAISKTLRELGLETKSKSLGGKTIRCIVYTEELLNNLFERYSYDITKITVITESAETQKRGPEVEHISNISNFDTVRNNRNNRKSVIDILKENNVLTPFDLIVKKLGVNEKEAQEEIDYHMKKGDISEYAPREYKLK